jgi:hypothetical protein
MTSEATQFRRDFWTRYAELYPDDGISPGWGRAYTWIPIDSAGLNVSLAVYYWGAGLWLRGRRGESLTESASRIQEYKEAFWEALNDAFDGRLRSEPATEWVNLEGGFDARREFDVSDPENWPGMAAWLHYMLQIYLRVIESAPVRQE